MFLNPELDVAEDLDDADLDLAQEEKHHKPYTARHAWNSVWRHIATWKRDMILLIILGVVSAILNGSVPYVTGKFFDALIALSQGNTLAFYSIKLWTALLVLWVILQLLANMIDWHMRNRQEGVWLKMRLNLEATGFIHLMRLPVAYHKENSMSGKMDIISNAGWRVSASVRNILSIAPQFLSMGIGIALAASINVMLAGILLAGVTTYTIILFILLRPIAALDDKAHRIWSEGWQRAAEKVHSAETVKQAAAEDSEERTILKTHMSRIYKSWNGMERHWANISFWQRMIVFATQLGVFVFAVGLIQSKAISVGELIAVNGYALMFFGPLVELGYSWQNIQNGITSAVHTEEILSEKQEDYHPAHAITPDTSAGKVTFDNVSFRYDEKSPVVLSHMSFTSHAGDVIALVGESGGGKSTAIGLLGGYYFPTEGAVRIDGVDTRAFDLVALRSAMAVVPQEVTLFNNSLKYNLRYGSQGATDEAVAEVARAVHLEEFLAELPKGMNTLVGERGVKLSVGQKQRVAIARAMLRNPKILILDEPTSALDAQTESYVTSALEKLMNGRTTFIIAHRLSTVRRADNILVFHKGAIAESGTHAELLTKKNGVYRNLYDHQIGLYE